MLDTDTCSFILRRHSQKIIDRLADVSSQSSVVISAATYSEMRYGEVGSKAPANLESIIKGFVKCLDGILPWNSRAVDKTIEIQKKLAKLGTPIGRNDAAIAGHAIVASDILVTNNIREFSRVEGLQLENWL